MKKEEIYKLIEFNGIYDDTVKKNLKKLIKKYHPDKNEGDSRIIKVIYEVKRELEEGKVSYNSKKSVKKNEDSTEFINKSECLEKINVLNKEKSKYDKKLKESYNKLSKNFKEYSDLYATLCKKQNIYCEIQDRIKNIKKINKFELMGYFVFVISLLIYLNNYSFITLIIVLAAVLYSININYKRYQGLENIKMDLKKTNDIIDKTKEEINLLREIIDKNSENIHNLEREILKIENDIRFFQNRFNKK